ncbi:MAG: hypothetical protein E7365_07530, partial [Clostridiales bacterium]|nr:hypothetical protein [Clostridiales bacterium]
MSKNAIMPLDDYISACEKIREKTGSTETIKSGELANKINDVYSAGKNAGGGSEFDLFWDEYQENGKRTNYDGAFFGVGWTEKTFKPKHDIVPVTIGHT